MFKFNNKIELLETKMCVIKAQTLDIIHWSIRSKRTNVAAFMMMMDEGGRSWTLVRVIVRLHFSFTHDVQQISENNQLQS